MTHALQPMSPDQQARFRHAYLAWLRVRDGVPDLAARRFDVRERFFADVDRAPTLWTGPPPVDQHTFDRNHILRQPEPGLSEVALWALATAKTNRAERYGVELSIAHTPDHPDQRDDPHTYVQIEEFYHTRILRDVLATLGLEVEVGVPNRRTQLLVRAMVHLPEGLSNVAVLAGEIVGVTIFTLLLERARVLFAAQPAALARIEALFAQILIDEVGHVHWLRSRVTPTQLAWTARLLPVVADSVLSDIPELGLLFGRDAVHRHARAADVDAAAAAYPERLVV